MSIKPHIVGELRILEKEFRGWLPDATLSQRNKALLTRQQLIAVERARSSGATPKQISSTINISVFRIHKIVNHARNMLRQELQSVSPAVSRS